MDYEYTNIGKLVKTHGLIGDISIRVDNIYLADFLNTEKVFIENHGQKIPYFIDEIKNNNPLLIKLEDISTPEEANILTNKTLYLDNSDITVVVDENSSLQYGTLVGYTIRQLDNSIIGPIEEIVEYPQQELARVNIENRAVLIPLIEEFICEIDSKTKIITLDLPEGILEL